MYPPSDFRTSHRPRQKPCSYLEPPPPFPTFPTPALDSHHLLSRTTTALFLGFLWRWHCKMGIPWPLAHSLRLLWRVLPARACISSLFLLFAMQEFTGRDTHFIYWFIRNGHLGCWYFLSFMNGATMNVHIRIL